MERLREWLARREHLRCYLVEAFVPVTASPISRYGSNLPARALTSM